MEISYNNISKSVRKGGCIMKNKKILIILILIISIMNFLVCNYSYATTDLGLGDLNNYKGNSEVGKGVTDRIGMILGIIRIVGTVVSVVMLVIIGIKYMVGSVEEKADYKSSMVPYVIGAALIFTGTYIPQVIYELTQGAIK